MQEVGRIKRFVLFLVALLTLVLLVNELTPRPFVIVFRSLTGLTGEAVSIGPYVQNIATVRSSERLAIPVDGLPDAHLTIYTPAQNAGAPKPLILYIHGGGWVIGTDQSVSSYAKLLASNGYVVANLGYSLAPEHHYPTPILQAVAALTYLKNHADIYNADPNRLFIGGNSAGAQMAGQLGAIFTTPGFAAKVGIKAPLPDLALRGLILFNGVHNFDTVGKDNFPGFRMYAWSYTGQKDYERYPRLNELSNSKNVTPSYPASFLTAGDADPIEPQTRELDAALRAANVEVTSLYWKGSGKNLSHHYMYQLDTVAAQKAYREVVGFLRAHAKP